MNSPSKTLKSIIENETERISSTFSGSSYHAIQNIVRRLDVVIPFFWESDKYSENEVSEFRELFQFGWAPALKPYYMDIDLNVNQPFPEMTPDAVQWADSLIIYYGKLSFCKQLLEYEKANLIRILNPQKNEFTFEYQDENTGIEQYDRISRDFFVNEIVERLIELKKEEKPLDDEKIKKKLRKIISNPKGKYISYATTPEIDEHYNQKGHYHILRLQGYDDFDKNDTFGSIEYWKYIDIIELVAGVALMHTDACLELKKMNDKVDLHNMLSYTYFKDKTINMYANYLGTSEEEINQIFSCITLTKENYDYYLEFPSTPPPMYFQVSENLMIRSISGCLSNPFDLLNRELKRKYKKDYFQAVNRREDRFRKELFLFFPQERIVKIPKEIKISYKGIKTDIDAVVYDTQTKTLGLFQLKWQDPFSHSMNERRSRMSNLFPKANEWIEKIRLWIFDNSANTILNSLQVNKQWAGKSEINEVCVFILSRNQMNFTGMQTDETVAWGSWHQLIESQSKIRSKFDDPIKQMFVGLKMLSPEYRKNLEEPPKRENIDLRFGNYRIFYNNNK